MHPANPARRNEGFIGKSLRCVLSLSPQELKKVNLMGKNILTKELLLKSVEEWNAAREAHPDFEPDFRGLDFTDENLNLADLSDGYFDGVNFTNTALVGANLSWAELSRSNFFEAYMIGADLSDAVLTEVNLSEANLGYATLCGADLSGADINDANLRDADLSNTYLGGTYFSGSILSGAVLSGATLRGTTFGAVDLSDVIGLETVKHEGPSTIGIDTIYASKGNIPEVFLRGCGVPDNFIEYARSLTAKAFDYYSCFISHSKADKDFADRLYADLQAKGVRCWYAPHDMEGGEHIDTQIDRAIKIHEKLLLILSESSINSNWVKREITKAVKREETEGKRVLFPISLVEFSTLEQWEFVDSKGRDLSEEIRKFYIPSFKGWENDNSLYTTEFDKLLKAFKDKSKQ